MRTDIRGYIHSSEMNCLAQAACVVPENGVVVEIGCFAGKSTSAFAEHSKPSVKVYSIDVFDDKKAAIPKGEPRGVFEEFKDNMKPYGKKVIPKKGKSADIGKKWRQKIDMLFIDGNHTERAVASDLKVWAPHVKKGGMILLHDYTENCGVKPAFEKYAAKNLEVKSRVIVGSMLLVGL